MKQILLVGISSLMVSLSTSHRTEKRELLVLHQVINWLIAGIVLALFHDIKNLAENLRLLSSFCAYY